MVNDLREEGGRDFVSCGCCDDFSGFVCECRFLDVVWVRGGRGGVGGWIVENRMLDVW